MHSGLFPVSNSEFFFSPDAISPLRVGRGENTLTLVHRKLQDLRPEKLEARAHNDHTPEMRRGLAFILRQLGGICLSRPCPSILSPEPILAQSKIYCPRDTPCPAGHRIFPINRRRHE